MASTGRDASEGRRGGPSGAPTIAYHRPVTDAGAHLHLVPRPRRGARRAAATLRRARRAAVHRRPPGVRAVVQAAAPRARVTSRSSWRRQARPPVAAHAAPRPDDPQGRGGPDRRAGDDDAAAVHGFRDRLDAASGFQSAQFRELEAVLGRRDRAALAAYAEGSPARRAIADAMARPLAVRLVPPVPRRPRLRGARCGAAIVT